MRGGTNILRIVSRSAGTMGPATGGWKAPTGGGGRAAHDADGAALCQGGAEGYMLMTGGGPGIGEGSEWYAAGGMGCAGCAGCAVPGCWWVGCASCASCPSGNTRPRRSDTIQLLVPLGSELLHAILCAELNSGGAHKGRRAYMGRYLQFLNPRRQFLNPLSVLISRGSHTPTHPTANSTQQTANRKGTK